MTGNVSHPAISGFMNRSGMNQTPGLPMFSSRHANVGDGAADNTIMGASVNQQAGITSATTNNPGIKLGVNLGQLGSGNVDGQLSAAFLGIMVIGIAAFYYATRHSQL